MVVRFLGPLQLIKSGHFWDYWGILQLRLDIPEGKFSSALFPHLNPGRDLFE